MAATPKWFSRFPVWVIVAFGFALPVVLCVGVVVLIKVFNIQTPEQRCSNYCKTRHLNGQLVRLYTRIQTPKESPTTCECN